MLMMQRVELKKDWVLSENAFRRLLDWLDEGSPSDGQKYLEMRQRLFAYFDRKNCLNPDELADETLNRVARRIEEEGTIITEVPAKYCYITARFVFMEYLRQAGKEPVLLDESAKDTAVYQPSDEEEQKEKVLKCLEKCLGQLEPENRRLITQYYYGAERVKIENRRALAESLNITNNALSIRACRIRDKLESCVKKCSG
jgi:DNA-directed RNA polymerase specialized sigma24 family protein